MSEPTQTETHTQRLLRQATAGDPAALDELLHHCGERLTQLAHRLLRAYPRVQRWAETGDILQSSLVRLMTALRSVSPTTSREFLALAALQIRRELIDMARHFYGPEGLGANHGSASGEPEAPARQEDPASLAQWSELHERIGRLPQDEREVIDLLFYQGLSQAEAAEVLGISLRTVQRRWHTALCQLHRIWRGE